MAGDGRGMKVEIEKTEKIGERKVEMEKTEEIGMIKMRGVSFTDVGRGVSFTE